MAKSERVDIVEYLTTRGNFVWANERRGCVHAFDATTNDVEVCFMSIGMTMSMLKGSAQEAFLQDLRDKGLLVAYHFTKLRPAPAEVAE